MAVWTLGYPETALADAGQAFKEAREIKYATTVMFVLIAVSRQNIFCGDLTRQISPLMNWAPWRTRKVR